MAEEPKKLNELVLNPESLPESLREKFAGKSVEDVLTSYEEAQKLAHKKSEELRMKEEELEVIRNRTEPEPEPEPAVDPDDEYNTLFGDDTYVTKESVDKRISAIEKKYEKKFEEVQNVAVERAMAQMEKRSFIDGHPEIFQGKNPQEADAIIKRIAGAGFVAGKQSLEGGLEAIREMAGELGMSNEPEHRRDVPGDIPHALGEYDNVEDEVAHFKKVHAETRGKISSLLK